jgi:16S rRNA C967 or C1407 C5-methylase (RsmB/RsmF family)
MIKACGSSMVLVTNHDATKLPLTTLGGKFDAVVSCCRGRWLF